MSLVLEGLSERVLLSASSPIPLPNLAPTAVTATSLHAQTMIESGTHSSAALSLAHGTISTPIQGSTNPTGSITTARTEDNIQANAGNTENTHSHKSPKEASPMTGSYSDTWIAPGYNGDYLWSDPLNWSMYEVPSDGMTATFDGSVANTECQVDVPTASVNIVLQNGYTAPFQTVGSNQGSLNIAGLQDNTPGSDLFNVAFLGGAETLNYQGLGQTYTPIPFNYGDGGKVNVLNGAIVNFDIGAIFKQSSGSPINVTKGTVNFGDNKGGMYTTFNLTNASADINVGPNGTVNFADTRTELIKTASGGAVINNNGTVNLIGGNGNAQTITSIDVPLQNHASLYVNGGRWWFGPTDSEGNSISMDAGTIKLNGNATVKAGQYTQTGGSFQIMDNQETFIGLSIQGNIFKGGTVQFTSASGYGVLNTDSIVFNGASLYMRIQGNGSNSDQIVCNGVCTLQNTSSINVSMVGPDQPLETWTLIQVKGPGSKLTGDFAQPPNLPPDVQESKDGTSWECVDF